MRVWWMLAVVLAVFSAVGFLATFFVEGDFARRAVVYQRVERTAEAELFGEVGTEIGSPQALVIEGDEFLVRGADGEAMRDEDGVLLLDEKRLQEAGVYPLQLKSVREVAGLSRLGLGTGVVFFGVLGWWLWRRGAARVEGGSG